MTRIHWFTLVLLGSVCVAGVAIGQAPNASEKTGDSYYLSMGKMYVRHIHDHAQILKLYAELGQPIPSDVIKEHVGAMREDLARIKANYAKLSDKAKNDLNTNKNVSDRIKLAESAINQIETASAAQQSVDAKLLLELSSGVTKNAKETHAATQEVHRFMYPQDAVPHFDQGVFAN